MLGRNFGVDTDLLNTITRGIVDASSSIINELSDVDPEGLEGAAAALQSILQSLTGISNIDYADILSRLSLISGTSTEVQGASTEAHRAHAPADEYEITHGRSSETPPESPKQNIKAHATAIARVEAEQAAR